MIWQFDGQTCWGRTKFYGGNFFKFLDFSKVYLGSFTDAMSILYWQTYLWFKLFRGGYLKLEFCSWVRLKQEPMLGLYRPVRVPQWSPAIFHSFQATEIGHTKIFKYNQPSKCKSAVYFSVSSKGAMFVAAMLRKQPMWQC